MGRRRRGHKPRDDPVQRRLEKERRLAAEERRGTRDSNRDPRSKTYRIPRITVVLTEQQRQWYQAMRCLHCGGTHRVYKCKERGLGKEKASTLLRAARLEFPDGAGAGPSSSGPGSRPGGKRTQDTGEKSGITPEAKRKQAWGGADAMPAPMPTSKPWFKPVQQTEHTLFIMHKDGTPLSEEKFNDIKSMYDKIRLRIGKANLQAKTEQERQFTPRCSRWNWSKEVSRITLKDKESFKWARTTFSEFKTMDLDQWKMSRGKSYCAYLTDRFDPSITGGWDQDDLTVAVWQAKVDLGLAPTDLFQFARAPKVSKGRLIFISVGEKGEQALQAAGYKIELGSAGDVLFTDNERFQRYKKEKKEQEKDILRQQRAAEDEDDEDDMTMTNESVVIVEEKGEKEKPPQQQQQQQAEQTPLVGAQGEVAMEVASDSDDLAGMELFMQEEQKVEQQLREQRALVEAQAKGTGGQ